MCVLVFAHMCAEGGWLWYCSPIVHSDPNPHLLMETTMHINPPSAHTPVSTKHPLGKGRGGSRKWGERGTQAHLDVGKSKTIHLSLLWFLTFLNVALLGAGVNTFLRQH